MTIFQNFIKWSMTPRWPLTPLLLRSHVWLYPRIILFKSHKNMSKYVDTVSFFFFKNLNHRSLTHRWPLTPNLLRSHVWLYPRIIVSKSHVGIHQCMWIQWSILQNTSYILLGRGDNLQLFISRLLKYEEWLYNIIDDKNFEINSLEPPCTGGLKIPHTPMGTCRNAKN